MTVYVDQPSVYITKLRYKIWSHMTADTPEELHAMAERLGLKREWFQCHDIRPAFHHYDIVPSKRLMAIRYGAMEEGVRDAVTRMRLASGKKCASCGVPLPQEMPGPGRPRVYCDIHRTPDEKVIRERAKRVNGGIPMNGRCRHVIVDGVCRRCQMPF